MSAYNTTLLDEDDNEIYPKTLAENVYDGNTRMDQKVDGIRTDLGNPSSASAVTGADAFSKISKLNSDLASMITKKSYTLSLAADASSPLGYYKAQAVTSDVAAYGDIIALNGYDSSGYPAIVLEQFSSNNTYIAASGKNAGNATIYVTFCKNTVIM